MRRKRKRELTPFQEDRAVYRAFSEQARFRQFAERIGTTIPWSDPTLPKDDDHAEE